MVSFSRFALIAAALAATAPVSGCRSGKHYDSGKAAEQKGDTAAAYRHYSRAATEHRFSVLVADGLERTRGAAATEAERAGLAAMDERCYDDAWRLFMQALEIQPDHATAGQLVRKLENDHPAEIAAAKGEWMLRGAVALAPPQETVLAAATPASPKRGRANTKSDHTQDPIETEQTPQAAQDEEAISEASDARDRSLEESSSFRQFDSRPVAPPESGDFLAVQTLSLEDRRYPKMVIAVDGIAVKVKDTEGDGEADLDLFNGKKRVQKIRDLEIGRSQTFRGQSGELYRLTLLGVHNKSDTVKIGVKRA